MSSMWIRVAVARTDRLVAWGVFPPQTTVSIGRYSDVGIRIEGFPLPRTLLVEKGIRIHLKRSWVLRYRDPDAEASHNGLCPAVIRIEASHDSSLIIPSNRLNLWVGEMTNIFIMYHDDEAQAQRALLGALERSDEAHR